MSKRWSKERARELQMLDVIFQAVPPAVLVRSAMGRATVMGGRYGSIRQQLLLRDHALVCEALDIRARGLQGSRVCLESRISFVRACKASVRRQARRGRLLGMRILDLVWCMMDEAKVMCAVRR